MPSPFVDFVTKDCSGVVNQPTTLLGNIPNTVMVYGILINNITLNPLRVTVNVKGSTNMSLITDYIIEPKQTYDALIDLNPLTLNALDTLEIYSNAPSQVFNVKVSYVIIKELA